MLVGFSPNIWYRLQNDFLGPNIALDVVNDDGDDSSGALKMARLGNYSGQHWQLRPHPDNDGTFALCTMFLGPEMFLGTRGLQAQLFDTSASDSSSEALKKRKQALSPGKWRIVPWMEHRLENDGRRAHGCWEGTFKLVDASREKEDLFLDTYRDTKELYVGPTDTTGKHWTITPIEAVRQPKFRI